MVQFEMMIETFYVWQNQCIARTIVICKQYSIENQFILCERLADAAVTKKIIGPFVQKNIS